MSTFHLQIVTPDGESFNGQAEKLLCRTICGDVGILANHCDYLTALGMGEARVTLDDGTVRRAACIGGLLAVSNGDVRLVATTFEWAEDIDIDRAGRANENAEKRLSDASLSEKEHIMAEAKLRRALIRLSVGKGR